MVAPELDGRQNPVKQDTWLPESSSSNCLFDRSWWLDAVAPGQWEEVQIEKGGEIVARWPFVVEKKLGLTMLRMPAYTQVLGPWLKPGSGKYVNRLSREIDLLSDLLNRMPAFDYFSQSFHYNLQNWLPLYWQGFQQTPRYTYVMEDLSDLESLWRDAQGSVRTDVRKAQNQVTVEPTTDVDAFLDLVDMTYRRQGRRPTHRRDVLHRLDAVCVSRDARRILTAVDAQGRPHAAAYIVWDQNSAYYLMGGANPELRSSGALTLVLWEAIRFASAVSRRFDFEGSMVKGIERFCRAFGARQMPYLKITKSTSRPLRIAAALRGAW